MPGQFDTTTKYLIEAYPADWVAFLGLEPGGAIQVIDANLSTVTAEVDKVVRMDGYPPRLVHLEFQSSYDARMGKRLARYNTMLHEKHELPVQTVLVLLRPAADGPAMSGLYQVELPRIGAYLSFAYGVRRIWHAASAALLAGPLGTLPLAPLGDAEPAALPAVLRAMDRRFNDEASAAHATQLRVVTYTLLGLRYPPDLVDRMMPGIRSMRDSLTYQAILEEGRAEGRAEEARELLIELGSSRYGAPDARTLAALRAINDRERLHRLAARLFAASGWAELLAGDEPGGH